MVSILPEEFRKGIAPLEKAVLLQQILIKKRWPPMANNTPRYWAYIKGKMLASKLLQGSDENRRCAITVTTATTDAQKANRAISRIIGKYLVPNALGYVRFFHRTEKGYAHVHIIGILKFPIMREPYECATARMAARALASFNRSERNLQGGRTKKANKLARVLSRALWRRHLGFQVEVKMIDDAAAMVEYAAHYLRGVAAVARYPDDKGVRLYSASGIAQFKIERPVFLTPGNKLWRLKLAAYAASYGAASMGEAKALLGSRWVYEAQAVISTHRLRAYPTEQDFRYDWGRLFTPEALGVRIMVPNYSPSQRQHTYRWEEVREEHRAVVATLLKSTLDLPEWAWPGKDS